MPPSDDKQTIAAALETFFVDLAPDLLNQLILIARLKHYRSGEMIFEDGSPSLGFNLLTEGRVKIYKVAPDGKEQMLHLFGPGEPFGEAALFLGRGYPASAQALSASNVVFLPREALLRLISANPEMALALLGVMAKRLARFTALLEAITLKEVPARLAAFILELARDNDQAELTLSKTQLASLLGTTPETISRSLGRLKNSGLISEEKPLIAIKDRPRLKLVAEGLLSPE